MSFFKMLRLAAESVRRITFDLRVFLQYRRAYLDKQLVLNGTLLAKHNNMSGTKLRDSEFSVFSQYGEDGLLQRLIDLIQEPTPIFVELGCGDFEESNTKFLTLKDSWHGFIIDGNSHRIKRVQNSYYYWKYNLSATTTQLTSENIEDTLLKLNVPANIGLLSIDIDGVDLFLFLSLPKVRAAILVVEFNPLFGNTRAISVPYRPDFERHSAHHSGQYWGASLSAWHHVASARGYALVGVTRSGHNAFFVAQEFMTEKLQAGLPEHLWCRPLYRDSRDRHGRLNYLTFEERVNSLRGMEVYNVVSGSSEVF